MSIYANITNRKPIYRGIYWGIYGQDAVDPLVFHALTHAGASGGVDAAGNTLLPYEGVDVLTGIGTLTEARTSTNYSPDHEGIWRSWGSGEAVREGWRQVENLVSYSEDFSNAAWTVTNATKTSTSVTDPDGGSTAATITADANLAIFQQAVSWTSGNRGIGSIWIRRRTGTGAITLSTNAGTDISGSLTSSWKRFSVSEVRASTTLYFKLTFATSGDAVDIAFAQVEDATGRTDTTNCSEYVPTTTAAAKKYFASTNPWEVTSNVATPTATVTELTDVWTVGSPAHTNSLPYSKPDTTNWSLTEGSAGALGTNMDFQTGDATGWLGTGTNWTIVDSGGGAYVARHATGNTGTLRQTGIFTIGNVYKLTYTVSNRTAGSVRIYAGLTSLGTLRSTNATFTEYLTASGDSILYFVPTSDFDGDIDNVIVQPAVIESYTTGLDGAADSAVLLHDDDGAALEYIDYTIAISNDSNTHVMRCWVKKDTDETRFPYIRARAYNGGTQVLTAIYLNTKTGAVSGSGVYEVRDTGHGWWEVLLSVTNNSSGNLGLEAQIRPAGGTTIGVSDVAATGSVTIADPVELHLNASIASVRGSSPIMTDGSAASTVATSLSLDIQNHDQDKGAYYLEYLPLFDGGDFGGSQGILASGSTNASIIYVESGGLTVRSNDGTTVTQTATPCVNGTVKKLGLAYNASEALKYLNSDGTTDEDAYDGTFATPTALTPFGISIKAVSYVRDIRRYDLPYASAKTKVDELTA